MKFWVTYPIVSHPPAADLMDRDGLARFAETAERAGFHGIGFTDHPAPSHKWLQAGGHDALDPFAALAFLAGRTERVLLMPHILVLAYRNPFLVAKSAATLDLVSGGRFVLAVAAGYQRAEFKALGVDYDRRNELFDEAVEVMRGVWSTDDFAYEGSTFEARGQTANPKPARVPIWIGGNSRLARERVARYGDGWCPFPAPAGLSRTTRTPALETPADLAAMLDDLHRMLDDAGRDGAEIDVAFRAAAGGSPGHPSFDAEAHLEEVGELGALGMTWNSVGVPGDSLAHALEALEQYGTDVIARSEEP
jgi:probable F420-dependent oxidoreductase